MVVLILLIKLIIKVEDLIPLIFHINSKLMPSRNDTLIQTLPVNDVQNSGHLNYNNYYASRANKRQSPSTVSAETFLKSRISLIPYTYITK